MLWNKKFQIILPEATRFPSMASKRRTLVSELFTLAFDPNNKKVLYCIAVYCTVSLSVQSALRMDPDPGLFVNQEQYFQPKRLDPDTDPH